eukprot:gene7289-9718_t
MRASNFQQIAGDRSIEQDRQSRTQNQNSSETEQRVPVQNQRRNLTKFDTSSVDTKQYKEPGNSKLLRQSSAQLYDEGKSQMSPHILRSKSTPLSKVEDPPQREDIQNKHLKLNAHEFPISVNINSLIFGSLIHQAVTGSMLYPGSDIDVAHYGLLLGRFEVVYESINDDVLHESSGQHKHFVTITGFHSVNIPMLEILRYQGKQLLQQNTEGNIIGWYVTRKTDLESFSLHDMWFHDLVQKHFISNEAQCVAAFVSTNPDETTTTDTQCGFYRMSRTIPGTFEKVPHKIHARSVHTSLGILNDSLVHANDHNIPSIDGLLRKTEQSLRENVCLLEDSVRALLEEIQHKEEEVTCLRI